jgi:hypothetical protein
MTAAGTHTLLSAVKALFTGRRLAVARHQLRLVVGYLKALAKVWPQGRRNLEEIQMIAKEVLGRKNGPKTTSETDPTASIEQQATDLAACVEGLENWNNPVIPFDTQDSLEPYWNLNVEFQPDIPNWFSGY